MNWLPCVSRVWESASSARGTLKTLSWRWGGRIYHMSKWHTCHYRTSIITPITPILNTLRQSELPRSLSPPHTAPVHGAVSTRRCAYRGRQYALLKIIFFFYLTAQIRGYSQKIRGYSPECPGLTTRLQDIICIFKIFVLFEFQLLSCSVHCDTH